MRYARSLTTVFAVLALSFLGLHLGAGLARTTDITELQAGLIVGAVITWAAFQIHGRPDPSRVRITSIRRKD